MNIQQLRAQIAALQDATMDENSNFTSTYDEGKFDALSAVDALLDSLQEEPVGDTQSPVVFHGLTGSVGNTKEEHVSEDLEKISYYFACMCNPLKAACSTSSPDPDVIKAFKAGAKWQKEQMMKDAFECKVKVDAGGYPYIDCDIEFYDYDKDIPLAKEGDKMKVIIVKDET